MKYTYKLETGAGTGLLIPTISPVPAAHIACVSYAGAHHVLSVSSGQVIEIVNQQISEDWALGYAQGFANAMMMPFRRVVFTKGIATYCSISEAYAREFVAEQPTITPIGGR